MASVNINSPINIHDVIVGPRIKYEKTLNTRKVMMVYLNHRGLCPRKY